MKDVMTNLKNRFPLIFAITLLALPAWMWTMSGRSSQASPKTFTGEVTDTICAKTGTHDAMMAKMPSMGRDKATCTKQCAQIGAKYVLYDEASKAVYSLDDQGKAQTLAGHKVRVEGTLAGDQIKVTNVEVVG